MPVVSAVVAMAVLGGTVELADDAGCLTDPALETRLERALAGVDPHGRVARVLVQARRREGGVVVVLSLEDAGAEARVTRAFDLARGDCGQAAELLEVVLHQQLVELPVRRFAVEPAAAEPAPPRQVRSAPPGLSAQVEAAAIVGLDSFAAELHGELGSGTPGRELTGTLTLRGVRRRLDGRVAAATLVGLAWRRAWSVWQAGLELRAGLGGAEDAGFGAFRAEAAALVSFLPAPWLAIGPRLVFAPLDAAGGEDGWMAGVGVCGVLTPRKDEARSVD